jgi:hypothetical protein
MAPLRSRLWAHRGKFLIGVVYMASLAFFRWRLPPVPRFVIASDLNARVLGASPDGALLAIARDGQLQLWSVATGEQAAAWPIPDLSVEHALFTADGRRLVASSFGEPKLWPQVARS